MLHIFKQYFLRTPLKGCFWKGLERQKEREREREREGERGLAREKVRVSA